mmetsp:Transcript_34663/g.104476  ORF Transcript_34663/g.104476 Transcript_34663/m.104476 type:complete len:222 (-) Transcript_34663:1975-2640(-)
MTTPSGLPQSTTARYVCSATQCPRRQRLLRGGNRSAVWPGSIHRQTWAMRATRLSRCSARSRVPLLRMFRLRSGACRPVAAQRAGALDRAARRRPHLRGYRPCAPANRRACWIHGLLSVTPAPTTLNSLLWWPNVRQVQALLAFTVEVHHRLGQPLHRHHRPPGADQGPFRCYRCHRSERRLQSHPWLCTCRHRGKATTRVMRMRPWRSSILALTLPVCAN